MGEFEVDVAGVAATDTDLSIASYACTRARRLHSWPSPRVGGRGGRSAMGVDDGDDDVGVAGDGGDGAGWSTTGSSPGRRRPANSAQTALVMKQGFRSDGAWCT